MANKDGRWLREIVSCCCLTTAGKTRQLLLNKIYIPFLLSLYFDLNQCRLFITRFYGHTMLSNQTVLLHSKRVLDPFLIVLVSAHLFNFEMFYIRLTPFHFTSMLRLILVYLFRCSLTVRHTLYFFLEEEAK